ncbi:hypothetical protein HN451_03810 [archaeon]|nr:hypothetical protein [archaeon]
MKVDYEKINSVYRYSNKDEKICNSLEDELLNGECNFFISISMISQLPKNYEHFMKFCDGIANPSWRSECFFLIADELAAQENFTNYYEKIEKACEKSYNSWNYGCFSHVPINMPKEKVLNFCKSLDEKNKLECINGYGFKIGTNLTNENIQPTISICNKLTPAYNEECINGLIWSIGTTSEKDKMKFFRNYCELLPVNYTDDCYQQYGHQLVIEDYILDMNYYCNFIPDNNKENCYYGIGLGMDMKTNSNLQKSIKFCNFAEDKYSNFCLRGIIYQLSRYIKDFSKKNSLLCNEFPDKLKEECLKKN